MSNTFYQGWGSSTESNLFYKGWLPEQITIFVQLQGNAWLPPKRKTPKQDKYIKVIEPQELEPDDRLEALQKQDEEILMLIADAVARFVNGR